MTSNSAFCPFICRSTSIPMAKTSIRHIGSLPCWYCPSQANTAGLGEISLSRTWGYRGKQTIARALSPRPPFIERQDLHAPLNKDAPYVGSEWCRKRAPLAKTTLRSITASLDFLHWRVERQGEGEGDHRSGRAWNSLILEVSLFQSYYILEKKVALLEVSSVTLYNPNPFSSSASCQL